jgi:hypothetical protein
VGIGTLARENKGWWVVFVLIRFDQGRGWPFGLLGRRIGLPNLVWCHDDSTLSLVRIQKIIMIEAKRKVKRKKIRKGKIIMIKNWPTLLPSKQILTYCTRLPQFLGTYLPRED